MKRTILRITILTAALACTSMAGIAPASASTSTSVSSVKQCDTSSCGNLATISGGGLAHDYVQIAAHAATNGLLENLKWVRLSARNGSTDPYTCLIQWSTTATSFTKTVNWNTASFLKLGDAPGCPSGTGNYGNFTRNGSLQIQVQASNNNNSVSSSTPFTINLNNKPSTPTWASTPSVSGTQNRQPVVTLSWNGSPEPDVAEYHFVRLNPDNTTTEFAVSDSSPSGQGCQLSGNVYTCSDSAFPASGFGGTYSYWLVSYRLSPSTADHCSLSGDACIQSQLSDQRSVSMTEPAPSPSGSPSTDPTATPGGTNVGPRPTGVSGATSTASGSSTDNPTPEVLGSTVNRETFCFTCGSYKKTLPYGNGDSFGSLPGDGGVPGGVPAPNGQNPVLAAGSALGSGTGGADPRQLWSSVAAGLVLLLTAAHVARILKATAH